MEPTKIFMVADKFEGTETLVSEGQAEYRKNIGEEVRLATADEYSNYSRDIGSIFDALEPNETIELSEGLFVLDDELDLIK